MKVPGSQFSAEQQQQKKSHKNGPFLNENYYTAYFQMNSIK
jgi:hypothetical protein